MGRMLVCLFVFLHLEKLARTWSSMIEGTTMGLFWPRLHLKVNCVSRRSHEVTHNLCSVVEVIYVFSDKGSGISESNVDNNWKLSTGEEFLGCYRISCPQDCRNHFPPLSPQSMLFGRTNVLSGEYKGEVGRDLLWYVVFKVRVLIHSEVAPQFCQRL